MTPRPDVVEKIAIAAFDGMNTVPDSTADEMVSAGLTVALRCIIVAKEMGAHMPNLRTAVEQLWAEVTDVEEIVH